jgi:hypothetical protein
MSVAEYLNKSHDHADARDNVDNMKLKGYFHGGSAGLKA